MATPDGAPAEPGRDDGDRGETAPRPVGMAQRVIALEKQYATLLEAHAALKADVEGVLAINRQLRSRLARAFDMAADELRELEVAHA